MTFQKTLKQKTSCVGIGLHSGKRVKLTLKPAPADTGIVFKRVDRGGFEIPATARHLACINHATCLARDGVRIETVEHILAALSALGVDNVAVELDAAEVPIMDGSAAPVIYLIHEAGIRELARARSFMRLIRPLSFASDGRQVAAYPAESLRVSYTINFDHPLLRHQEHSIEISELSFAEDVAPARTFGFMKDVELMRQKGLALGGSLDNAVVLGETGVLNNPLRFPDEFVRHKILDILGDLSLLGRPLLAHVVAVRAGHQLHTDLVQGILASPESWEVVTSFRPSEPPAFAQAPAGPRAVTEPVS
ncbi:MAG: UDP-3-O-acyl-N-acetylglucosamine deacetylase, partial [Acidobacteriota bacterium]